MLLEVRDVAVEAQRFQFAVSGDQQRAAGRFVAAAGLDSDEAVLHHVDAADGIASADFVQQLDELPPDQASCRSPTRECPASKPISTCSSRSGASFGER